MDSDPNHNHAAASVLAVFLCITGLLCALAAAVAGLAGVDPAELVRQMLERSQGTVSDETMRWLHAAHPLRTLGLLGVSLIFVATCVHLVRRPFQISLERPRALSPAFLRGWLWIVALLIALLLSAKFHATLGSGYFRYDDFELLAVARQDPSWSMLWSPHGDHVLPLTRLFAWAGLHFFGTSAWAYNFLLLVCMGGLLFSACRVLAALNASRTAQLLFLVLVVFWSPWAELMAGYYILSTYLLIAWMGLIAFHAYLSWRRNPGVLPLVVFLVCMLLAPLVDISGAYVLAAGAVFLASGILDAPDGSTLRQRLSAHRGPLLALTAATAISAGWLFYVYTRVHPNTFLDMASAGDRSLTRTVADFFYAFDAGLLLSLFVPFIYARLPVLLLLIMGGGMAAVWLGFMFVVTRTADKSRRLALLTALLVTAGICLMVVLGRPSEHTMIVRWAAKHIGPAYLWLCLLISLGWDVLWRQTRERARFAECTAIVLFIFIAAQTALGTLGMAVDFPPFGYPAEIRDAERRRSAVTALRQSIPTRLVDDTGAPLTIPALDGRYIESLHPGLFHYNLSHYLPFFGDAPARLTLVRNSAMQSWHTRAVRTVPSLRDAVSPLFLERLATDSHLRRYYFAEIPLTPEPITPPPLSISPRPSDAPDCTSDGHLEIPVRTFGWNPETAPRLRLWIERNPVIGSRPLRVEVIFFSDAAGSDWHGHLDYPEEYNGAVQVDLRQVYAFALSRRVSNLRVVLADAGRYRLYAAEITP